MDLTGVNCMNSEMLWANNKGYSIYWFSDDVISKRFIQHVMCHVLTEHSYVANSHISISVRFSGYNTIQYNTMESL